jgi:integrase
MSDLAAHVQDYLRFRRALGYKLVFPGHALPQLAAYLDAAGASALTVELAIAWAKLPAGVTPQHWAARLSIARGFARYLQTIDPATEIPPRGVWSSVNRRPAPYLWSPVDVRLLLDSAGELHPPLRAASHQTLLGLLATTGLRIGEALALTDGDVDLEDGILTIHDGKSGSRLVPMHPSTTSALQAYVATRERHCAAPTCVRFFLSHRGGPLGYRGVHQTFVTLTTALGLRTATVHPRIHDLRHSLAVRTLIGWLRDGQDVAARMSVLSSYLGHVNPAGTYWYFSAAPELMDLAAARLNDRLGAPR